MFCKKCGKPIGDDSMFCQFCGASISTSEADNPKKDEIEVPEKSDNTVNQNPNTDQAINKDTVVAGSKKVRRILATIIIVGIAVLGAVLFFKFKPTSVDLSKYIYVNYEPGYDGYGTAIPGFDREAFIGDYINKIKYTNKKGSAAKEFLANAIEEPTIEGNNGYLSNGDTIVVKFPVDEDYAKKLFNVNISGDSINVAIPDGTFGPVTDYRMDDIIIDLDAIIEGMDGEATATLKGAKFEEEGLVYSLSKNNGICTGDKIIMTCSCPNEDDFTRNTGKRLDKSEGTKEKIVEKLPTYNITDEDINEDFYKSIYVKAMNFATHANTLYIFQAGSHNYAEDAYPEYKDYRNVKVLLNKDIQPQLESIVICSKNDHADTLAKNNEVYAIMKVPYKAYLTNDDRLVADKAFYFPVHFENVIIDKNGASIPEVKSNDNITYNWYHFDLDSAERFCASGSNDYDIRVRRLPSPYPENDAEQSTETNSSDNEEAPDQEEDESSTVSTSSVPNGNMTGTWIGKGSDNKDFYIYLDGKVAQFYSESENYRQCIGTYESISDDTVEVNYFQSQDNGVPLENAKPIKATIKFNNDYSSATITVDDPEGFTKIKNNTKLEPERLD